MLLGNTFNIGGKYGCYHVFNDFVLFVVKLKKENFAPVVYNEVLVDKIYVYYIHYLFDLEP